MKPSSGAACHSANLPLMGGERLAQAKANPSALSTETADATIQMGPLPGGRKCLIVGDEVTSRWARHSLCRALLPNSDTTWRAVGLTSAREGP